MKAKHILAASAVVVMGSLAGSGALAATYNWNVGNGEFTNSASWNPAGPPGTADHAVFNQAPAYNVTLAQSLTNSDATFSQGTVTLNLQGNTYTLTNTSVNGLNANGGALVITNGTVDAASASLSGAGPVSVDSSGRLILESAPNDIADINGGTLNIVNGGQAVQVGGGRLLLGHYGAGVVNVTGAGSVFTNTYMLLGFAAPGILNVLNGGQFINIGPYLLTSASGSTITVGGSNSLLKMTSGYLTLGAYGGGYGALIVNSNANMVVSGLTTIGAAGGSTARATVDNGTFSNFQWTVVGGSGTGSMIVTNGGKVYSQWGGNAYDSDIGQFAGSTGTVQVVGTGSRWDSTHNVIVGGYNNYNDNSGGGAGYDGGVGTLKVGTGAVVSAGTTISIRGSGTLDLDGGTVSTPKLTLVSGGVLKGSGTINATVTNAGTLSPGHSVGAITVTSNLVLTSTSVATFDFNSASSFDQVGVGQSFTAGGVLNLQFNYAADTNNFTFFKIFDVGAGTGVGSFSQINWLGTPPQGGYRAGFIGNDFVITAIPEPGIAGLALVGGLAALALRRRFEK